MTQIHLEVVGEWFLPIMKEVGERFIHQFHQQDRLSRFRILICPQVLDNMRVLDGTQEPAFPHKSLHCDIVDQVARLEEDRMEKLGSTGKVITQCPANCAIGPDAQLL